MSAFKAYAAFEPGLKLKPFEYHPGDLQPSDLEVKVRSCGVCHSDLSMALNDWGMTQYPFVPGHEVIGEVAAVGSHVTQFKKGDLVGVGWYSKYCMTCSSCLSGHQNLCAQSEGIIVGRHGGFADRVRCHWSAATPLPKNLNLDAAGPLFCGGITVFGPIDHFQIKPTDRVGVVGVGGLGHLAVQFLNKWGCEVTAFTSHPDKSDWVKKLGAHHIVQSNDAKAINNFKGQFDFIIVTANVTLPWDAYISSLAPNGRLHFVGAVLEPVPVAPFSLIGGQKSVSGSPLGGAATTRRMLDFCERHKIEAMIEKFPMSKVNEALQKVESGQVRFRAVLIND